MYRIIYSMDYSFEIPQAFAMQHDNMMSNYFHHTDMNIVTEKITKDTKQMLRDSKATSFNEIPSFVNSYPVTDNISHVAHRR